ncbi:MAG: 3-hydroxyacyl-ACP dehydratase FabZ family protein [Gemmatimonadaceae bacterium]
MVAHRFPFLLVDRVRVVEPGRRVVGTKRVSAGEWWCDPRTPVAAAMPFGLVIEALAQTAGVLLRDLTDGAPGALAYFMGADQVRLRRPARPGDELTLAVTLRQWRRGICRTRAVATVDGAPVARALLTIIVRATG